MFLLIVAIVGSLLIQIINPQVVLAEEEKNTSKFWEIQSIDTMKYSRDLAREKSNDKAFEQTISDQVYTMAQTGATHLAVATPYDDEFKNYLGLWVKNARENNLKVWFKGNWSGWEGWFGYEKITPDKHIDMTLNFVKSNPETFQDGDIFSPCPECENGAIGDPRNNMGVAGYRKFIIDESTKLKEIFKIQGKNVRIIYPMNGDVAKIVMDEDTTLKLGGLVVIDHYVKDADILGQDIDELVSQTKGKIILGEFGAPIPDIHGEMDEESQSIWISQVFDELTKRKSVIGLNYWVGFGGSTSIWTDDGKPRKALESINKYFKPKTLSGVVVNELGTPVADAEVKTGRVDTKTSAEGKFQVPVIDDDKKLSVAKEDYVLYEKVVDTNDSELNIILEKKNKGILFKVVKFIKSTTYNIISSMLSR